jgi:hypothetical protein
MKNLLVKDLGYPHFHLRDSCRHARYPRELVVCSQGSSSLCRASAKIWADAASARAGVSSVVSSHRRLGTGSRGTPIRHPRFQCGARA